MQDWIAFIHLSPLRLLGLVIGLIALRIVVRRLRADADSRKDVAFLFIFGLGLTLVSLFPNLMRFPSEVVYLGDMLGGQVMAAGLLAVLGLWALLIHERSKVLQLEKAFNDLVTTLSTSQFLQAQGERFDRNDLLVVMPAYNEGDNLSRLLPRFPPTIGGRRVVPLIVDDGSQDHTPEVAKAHGVAHLRLPVNRGQGAALRSGLAVAEAMGIGCVVTLDADGQHQPEEIAEVVAPVLAGEADLVIGSRTLGRHQRVNLARLTGIHVFNGLLRLVTGLRITDCTSGFRAMRVAALPGKQLVQRQNVSAEVIIMAAKAGLRVVERPITVTLRLSGETKKGSSFHYGTRFFVALLKTWLR